MKKELTVELIDYKKNDSDYIKLSQLQKKHLNNPNIYIQFKDYNNSIIYIEFEKGLYKISFQTIPSKLYKYTIKEIKEYIKRNIKTW